MMAAPSSSALGVEHGEEVGARACRWRLRRRSTSGGRAMTVTRTSSGSARYSCSKVPRMTEGHSVRWQHGVDQRLILAPAGSGDGGGWLCRGLGGFFLFFRRRRRRRMPRAMSRHRSFGAAMVTGGFAMQDAMAAAGVARRRCLRFRAEQQQSRAVQRPKRTGAHETLGLAGAPVHVLGPVEGEGFFG